MGDLKLHTKSFTQLVLSIKFLELQGNTILLVVYHGINWRIIQVYLETSWNKVYANLCLSRTCARNDVNMSEFKFIVEALNCVEENKK